MALLNFKLKELGFATLCPKNSQFFMPPNQSQNLLTKLPKHKAKHPFLGQFEISCRKLLFIRNNTTLKNGIVVTNKCLVSPEGKLNSLGNNKETELNRRYFIVGERRFSSYWWASVISLGGLGFLLTGISSYLKYNLFSSFYSLIPNANAFFHNAQSLTPTSYGEVGGEGLVFFPQGLLMCFYGSLGLLLSIYWWLLIYWNVGGGFNEFNKKEGFMRIFRWGYPGKNRRIDIVYSLKDIEAIRVELKQSQGLLASEQTIFVRLLATPPGKPENSVKQGNEQKPVSVGAVEKLKEKREIPLGGIGQPLTLKEIEKQASELANYLQVTLEGL